MLPHETQLANMRGNILCAVDIETTGRVPGYHEIVQIAIQPLDNDFKPLEGVKPFYHCIRPIHPERAERAAMEISGLKLEDLALAPDQFQVADWLREWVRDLKLPFQRAIVPLAHNWAYEKGFLTDWLGIDGVEELFFSHPRDTMLAAIFINDFAVASGEKPPFAWVNLSYLCKCLNIQHNNAHDALADALSAAEVYRRLIRGFGTRSLLIPVGMGSPGSQ